MQAKTNAKKARRNNSFRFAERCLYEFPANRARLQALREERAFLDRESSAKGQKYDLNHGGGYPSDAVSERLQRIEKVEEDIRHLEGRVRSIERLLVDLESPFALAGSPKKELLKIAQLYYFGENVWQAVARELHLERSSFFRRRNNLVRLVIAYIGL